MEQALQELVDEALKAIKAADSMQSLEQLRVNYLGKKGQLTHYLQQLKTLDASERPQAGKSLNEAKQNINQVLTHRRQELKAADLAQHLKEKVVDVTLAGRGQAVGSLHPISQTFERVCNFFQQMGFSIEQGPEIEDDYYNFAALNIPEHHPARAMQDTFYFPGGLLLRTHTSPVQIRTMKGSEPPYRIIAPGRVYRSDSDVTHTPMFHQVEGLLIDEGIHFGDLKGILQAFIQHFFAKDLATRLRPSYFPFTEPSAELDMQCVRCEGKGCRICSHTGWLEVLGCGMVHPNVLEECDIDSEKYTGFAFGVGIDRLSMLRYSIDDLRRFFTNDIRFLEQF